LLELINDVLDISKIEAGQLEVQSEPVNLPALIERVISVLKPVAEKKGLYLTASVSNDLGEIISDRRRLEQVFINLINNAIKFTEKGGVTVAAELLGDFNQPPGAAPGTLVKLSVADTGIGIKPQDLDLLFRPFRQIDSGLTRLHEGTGLGLAICRKLLELLGGHVTAVSEWSKGSEFIVTIPLHGALKP